MVGRSLSVRGDVFGKRRRRVGGRHRRDEEAVGRGGNFVVRDGCFECSRRSNAKPMSR